MEAKKYWAYDKDELEEGNFKTAQVLSKVADYMQTEADVHADTIRTCNEVYAQNADVANLMKRSLVNEYVNPNSSRE